MNSNRALRADNHPLPLRQFVLRVSRSAIAAENFADDASRLIVKQRLLTAIAGKSELRGVESEKVQQRGMIIVMGHRIGHRFVSQFIGLAVDATLLDASTGEPHREAVGVVIAADVLLVLNHR